MTEPLDVALIGAGPYALSIAAHLAAAKVEHRVFGTPMRAWREHMPPGMMLKSYGESSNLSDPPGNFTLERFSQQAGIPYHPSQTPVSLESFIGYGCAFQRRFVPHVAERHLMEYAPLGALHELRFENGDIVVARNVVMAVGVVPFAFQPPIFANLPRELVSHSSAHGTLEHLRGKEVTVVGGGSSALDIAALLAELGGRVTLVLRKREMQFQSVPSTHRSLLHQLHAPDAHGLGDGWLLRLCADAPGIIHALPDRIRRAILANTLGPSGGYFIRDLISSRVAVRTGQQVIAAAELKGKVRLTTMDRHGRTDVIESDHLVAATGYRVNMRQLAFLDEQTLARLRMADDAPILSSAFESSIPGLFFVGLASARSFGPAMRFLVGARHTALRLTATLCRRLSRRTVALIAAGDHPT